MPIYEYICEDCGKRYERVVLAKREKISCPACGSSRRNVQFSVFSAHSGGAETCFTDPDSGTCGCTPHSCGCRN